MAVSQGTMDKKYVSAIDFLDQRDIDPNIYDQSRDRAFTDIMKIVNRYKPAIMYNYHNFVNNDVREVGTISAVTTTGTAAPVFTINTAANFPRAGDLIQSPQRIPHLQMLESVPMFLCLRRVRPQRMPLQV